MKVLCTTTSGAGHFRPLLPVARALVDAGHEVEFACPDSAQDPIASAGFTVRTFAEATRTPEQIELFERAQATGDVRHGEAAVALGFGYVSPMAALPRLTRVMDDVRPDLVVRDPAELASLMLCEQRDVPSAIAMGGLQSIFDFLGEFVAEPLGRLRAEVGTTEGVGLATDGLIVTATPPSFDVPSALPIEVLRYGLNAPRRPIAPDAGVYATLGTEVMTFVGGPPLMRRIIAVLGQADAGAVVTTGIDPDDVDLGEVPAGCRVARFVAHDEVIPASRAVITHGGAGTVQDALLMGRPMVVVPQFADQFANGDRVEEVGVGRVVVGDEQLGDGLVAAVEDVLGGRFDERAWQIAEEAAALPPLTSAVERLESLAAR